MNYSLAKELKEAGFPQHGRDVMTATTAEDAAGHEPVWYPYLEELIEACGEDFNMLTQNLSLSYWEALLVYRSDRNPMGFLSRGATPTEAVARLWLALHKKP